jgi:hypothetical protein
LDVIFYSYIDLRLKDARHQSRKSSAISAGADGRRTRSSYAGANLSKTTLQNGPCQYLTRIPQNTDQSGQRLKEISANFSDGVSSGALLIEYLIVASANLLANSQI